MLAKSPRLNRGSVTVCGSCIKQLSAHAAPRTRAGPRIIGYVAIGEVCAKKGVRTGIQSGAKHLYHITQLLQPHFPKLSHNRSMGSIIVCSPVYYKR